MGTTDLQKTGRLAVRHGYRHSLLWANVGPAMLAPYAYHSLYLNVSGERSSVRRVRVQVGGREWGDPFQRSAPRECSKGGAEGSPNLQCSEDDLDAFTSGDARAAGGEGLSVLQYVGADQRPGLYEYRYGFGRDFGSAHRSAGRHGGRDDGRRARSGSAGQWRPIYDYSRRSGRAHHTNGREGCLRGHGVFFSERDIPRSSAVAAVADESDQKTLNPHRGANWRSRQVRHGC